MAKMKIFNRLEETEFESLPKFNSVERKHFFATSVAINELLENLRTPTNKVCFLVSLDSPFKVFLEDNCRFQNDSIQQRVTKIHQ